MPDVYPRHVKKFYPGVRVFHENKHVVAYEADTWQPGRTLSSLSRYEQATYPLFTGPDAENIDLVVTFGGDGTILHASSLFSAGAVPPVLSFSLGTLGFLLPFRAYHPHPHISTCLHAAVT